MKYSLLVLVALLLLVGGGIALINKSDNSTALAVYTVGNMICGSCVSNIQEALKDEPGVGRVTVNVTSGESQVEFDPEQTDAPTIAARITSAGYPATLREELSVEQYLDLQTEEKLLADIYVARVGTRLVPRTELDAYLKQQLSRPETAVPVEKLRAEAWNNILQRELLLYAAEQNRVVIQDSEVDERIAKMRAGMKAFDAFVATRYGSFDNFKRTVKNDMIINRNIELNVVASVTESEPNQKQQVLQQWYRQLVEKTPVTIFDPQLKSTGTVSGGSGCGGCC